MTDSVAGVVLAAGMGRRLAPLTSERPKALCPVGGRPLVERAVEAVRTVTADVAVNAQAAQPTLVEAVERLGAHPSVERELAGTGGALVLLRPWIDGRDVLLVNADAVHDGDLRAFVAGWDRERPAFLLAEAPGTPLRAGVRLCAALLPWGDLASLPDPPCSIHTELWAPAAAAGRVVTEGGVRHWFDCGTPARYLAANLWCSGGRSVVGEGAVVAGQLRRCVVWDGAVVHPGERLRDAVRTAGGRTVLVRGVPRT